MNILNEEMKPMLFCFFYYFKKKEKNMIETIMLFMKTNALRLWIALIPAGFFVLNKNEGLVVQLLFITLGIDILLGVALAIKLRRFSSHRLGACIPKGIGYMVAIIILLVISKLVPEASALFFYTISFFVINELTSHIENLSLLGVKFPDKLMVLINKNYEDKEATRKKWINKNKDLF